MLMQVKHRMNKPANLKINKTDSCVIGIDFGTTNSAMSRYCNSTLVNGPESLNFPITGNVLYPSVAYLDDVNNDIKTGIAAYNKRHIEPEKVISSVKRHLTEKNIYKIKNRAFSNVDIAKSIIFDFINEIILTDHEFKPSCVAVTVPYYFGENENVLIKSVAEQAIYELIQCETSLFIIPEQVAASIASIYNLNIKNIESEVFFIYDIGGGTLDLTLVRVTYNENDFSYEVLANDDIDELLYEYILSKIEINNTMLTEHQRLINKARLLTECKEVKHHLSYSDNYTFLCNNLFGVDGGYVEMVITRDVLNDLLSGLRGSQRNLVLEFQQCVQNLYSKAKINPASVKYTIPIGGTSFIPIFRTYANSAHNSALEIASGNIIDNLTLVANGASIYAAMMSDKIYNTLYHPFGSHNSIEQITTRISHSLYIEKFNGKLDLIIPANSVSPVSVHKRYFPAKLKKDGKIVDLAEVHLFQGEGESRKRGRYIGMIDFSDYLIYTHNRTINEIPIDITIEATDTLVKAHCYIPLADFNCNNIEFTQIIHD